jgi:hypothetical protein
VRSGGKIKILENEVGYGEFELWGGITRKD